MFFVDSPFGKKKDTTVPSAPSDAKAEPEIDFSKIDRSKTMWIPPEVVKEKTEQRVPYFEAKEAMDIESKEMKAVRAIIGTELRDHCRPEIDEYVDCMAGRIWTVLKCKPHAKEMRRCLKKIETPEYIERRTNELLEKRQRDGTSLLKSGQRGNYNNCFWEDRDPQTTRHNVEGTPK